VLPGLEGLNTTALRISVGRGVRVVVGRNNAGKTRLLRALAEGRLRATVRPGDYTRARGFEHAALNAEWGNLGRMTLTWSRNLARPPDTFAVGAVSTNIEIDPASFEQATEHKPGLREGNTALMIAGELWAYLRPRPAVLVSTDRYFAQEAPLVQRSINLAEPALWAGALTRIANSSELPDRELWKSIRDAFSELTEGLSLQGRMSPEGAAIVQVEDNGRERPLNACGDGLRDLAGILMLAATNAGSDLLIDEPGLRLHPHTQRALMGFFDREANDRAIWIASHDGVFIGAPAVKQRFEVHRDSFADRTTVTELASPEKARAALMDLGWLPGDAFLADRVLLCEGDSDRAAFEGVREWLVEEDISWSGMRVSAMFGSGSVWGHDRRDLLERIQLVRDIAPHAAHAVFVDRDTALDETIRVLRERLSSLGVRLEVLPVRELENLWLDPAVAHCILVGLAAIASEIRGEEIQALSTVEIATRLQEHDLEQEKGSEVLEALCGPALKFDKTQAAKLAVGCLREKALSRATVLSDAVKRAFAPPASTPREVDSGR